MLSLSFLISEVTETGEATDPEVRVALSIGDICIGEGGRYDGIGGVLAAVPGRVFGESNSEEADDDRDDTSDSA